MVLVGPATDEATLRVLESARARALTVTVDLRVCTAPADSATFRRALAEAHALILTDRLPAGALDAATRLELVSVTATGVHAYLDPEAATARGVAVAYVPSYADPAIAEHTLALLLALAKNLVPAHQAMRSGQWPTLASSQLSGRTAGVLGIGGIGLRVVRALDALGMEVLVWTRTPDPARLAGTQARYASLPELFTAADAVTLHLALTDETRGLVDEALLARARAGLILVNTARAELIAPGALENQLRARRIRAGLDVFRDEPRVSKELRTLPGVLLSPHAAFNTAEGFEALVLGAIENAVEHLAGRPRNQVARNQLPR